MKITFAAETIDDIEKASSPEEELAMMQRHKCKVLLEMKVLSIRMAAWMKDGIISQQGESDKYPERPNIPDAESRKLLTDNKNLNAYIVATFVRFRLLQEVLANSLNVEIEALEKKTSAQVGS